MNQQAYYDMLWYEGSYIHTYDIINNNNYYKYVIWQKYMVQCVSSLLLICYDTLY